MAPPQIHEDPMYQLLRDEEIEAFNTRKKAEGVSGSLDNSNYRGLDLRGLDADGLDLNGAYFRNADLRGIDFRNANLEGASICGAKISGCYFPVELSAEEIRLSWETGIRMRYNK